MTDRVKTEPKDYKIFFFFKLKKKERKEGRKKEGERETERKSGKQIKHQKNISQYSKGKWFWFLENEIPLAFLQHLVFG